jgi:uncharacterized membrane protein
MLYLSIGLLLVLGIHSVRMLADDWRSARIAAWGIGRWRLFYSLVSLSGFVLLIHGFGQARLSAALLWAPPAWGRAATLALMLPTMLLLMASAFPRSHIRRALTYPAHWATLLFAGAHLFSNSRLHHLLLFGGFGLWAVLALLHAYRSQQNEPEENPPASVTASLFNLLSGTLLWFAFARWLHPWLIGVAPFR